MSIEDEGGREGGGRIDWIDLEASREGGRERGRALHPLEVWVKEGEVLYLPALWFHEVTQTCPTIAGTEGGRKGGREGGRERKKKRGGR